MSNKSISSGLEDALVEFQMGWGRSRPGVTCSNLLRIGDALYHHSITQPFEKPKRRATSVVKLVREKAPKQAKAA